MGQNVFTRNIFKFDVFENRGSDEKIIFYTFSSFFRKKSTECRLHIRPDRVYTKYLKHYKEIKRNVIPTLERIARTTFLASCGPASPFPHLISSFLFSSSPTVAAFPSFCYPAIFLRAPRQVNSRAAKMHPRGIVRGCVVVAGTVGLSCVCKQLNYTTSPRPLRTVFVFEDEVAARYCQWK